MRGYFSGAEKTLNTQCKRLASLFVLVPPGLFPNMLVVYWSAQYLPSGLISILLGFSRYFCVCFRGCGAVSEHRIGGKYWLCVWRFVV